MAILSWPQCVKRLNKLRLILQLALCLPGPCITNVIATCRENLSQWESSFLWKLRCHWLKFLRRVAKTLVIQGPGPSISAGTVRMKYWKGYVTMSWLVTHFISVQCLFFMQLTHFRKQLDNSFHNNKYINNLSYENPCTLIRRFSFSKTLSRCYIDCRQCWDIAWCLLK